MKQKINYDAKGTIRTNSGNLVSVTDTDPNTLLIQDIAHALSSIPRFGGHLNRHYTVAQHSVLASRMAKTKKDKKAALMHDGSEGYLWDVPTPIKHILPEYRLLEDKLMTVIATKFGFEWPMSDKVKRIDRRMLDLEWKNLVETNNKEFEVWSRAKAKREFLKTYKELFIDKKDCVRATK
jgi:hypothetical protein